MRPFDTALALVLAALAVVETWADGDGAAYDAARAALAAATVLPLAVRRTWPGLMALAFATGMTLESLLTESPDQMAVLVAAVIAAYSVTAHSETREGVLGLGLVLIAISASIALDPSDELANIPPTLVIFAVLPGAFGFAWQRRGRDVTTLSARVRDAEQALADERAGRSRQPVPALALTSRQHDVVLLVARGFSNKEIGAALHLTENTIKGYVSEILASLHLRDRTQLVIRAYDSGLVVPPEPD